MMRQFPRFCVKVILMSVVMFACIGVASVAIYQLCHRITLPNGGGMGRQAPIAHGAR